MGVGGFDFGEMGKERCRGRGGMEASGDNTTTRIVMLLLVQWAVNQWI